MKMTRDSRKRDRERSNRQRTKLRMAFRNLQTQSVFMKRVFRQRGIHLPFYDFYDSYVKEFGKVAARARKESRSLLDIIELDDRDYFTTDHSSFAEGMEEIRWNTELSDYGSLSEDTNICGFTCAFRAPGADIRTLIVIRKRVPASEPNREGKYVHKLIALLHELGHVDDIEHQVNFNHAAGTFDAIEAEVYAHLHALKRMAKRNYFQCFTMLMGAFRKHMTDSTYLGEVAKLVLERVPPYQLVDISDVPLEPLTADDLRILGPDGRRAFGLPG